jgi:hypothetical protein
MFRVMTNPLRLLPALALGGLLLCAGCETTKNFSVEEAPDYMVVRGYSPFYRTGPMQSRGPDAALPAQTRVKVLRLEMGYSLVQLEDARTGYVANENIAVAPPRRPEPEVSESRTRNGGSRRSNGSSRSSQRFRGEQINDIPLPDSVPPPDLNIAPEDMPMAPPPSPQASPEKPKFRF